MQVEPKLVLECGNCGKKTTSFWPTHDPINLQQLAWKSRPSVSCLHQSKKVNQDCIGTGGPITL
jgi:hypothetical protein